MPESARPLWKRPRPDRLPRMLSALLLLLLAANAAADKPAGILGDSDPCTVVRQVDGDTTDVLIRGKSDRTRLLAIDTEESWPSSSKPVTPFGLETSKWAKGFITAGQLCWVEYGPERRDVYDRLLAYLWLKESDGWQMYNLQVVQLGYSPYFTKYGYSDLHHDQFDAAQKAAQKAKRGLWDPANSSDLRGDYLGKDGLLSWWNDRADALKAYQQISHAHPEIIDTRTRYGELRDHLGKRVTVFTAIRQPDEKGADWMGKCEGKLYEPFEVVSGGDSAVEEALRSSVGRFRYFTGAVDLKEDDPKTIVMTISSPADVATTVDAPAAKATPAKPAPAPAKKSASVAQPGKR